MNLIPTMPKTKVHKRSTFQNYKLKNKLIQELDKKWI